MTKFALVVDNTDSEETQKFIDEAPNAFDEFLLINDLRDLLVILPKNEPSQIFLGDRDISDINILMIRSTKHNRVAKSVLAHTCFYKTINVIDPLDRFPVGFASKLLSSIERHKKRCITDTYISFSHQATCKLISQLPPVITLFVKPIKGSQSRGTEKLDGLNHLREYSNNFSYNMPLYVQKYINIELEYRFFVVNSNIIASMKKVRREDGSIKYKRMRFRRLGEFVIEHVSDTGILGVDACKDVNGDFYIIEANRSPMFRALENRTGLNIASLIFNQIKGE